MKKFIILNKLKNFRYFFYLSTILILLLLIFNSSFFSNICKFLLIKFVPSKEFSIKEFSIKTNLFSLFINASDIKYKNDEIDTYLENLRINIDIFRALFKIKTKTISTLNLKNGYFNYISNKKDISKKEEKKSNEDSLKKEPPNLDFLKRNIFNRIIVENFDISIDQIKINDINLFLQNIKYYENKNIYKLNISSLSLQTIIKEPFIYKLKQMDGKIEYEFDKSIVKIDDLNFYLNNSLYKNIKAYYDIKNGVIRIENFISNFSLKDIDTFASTDLNNNLKGKVNIDNVFFEYDFSKGINISATLSGEKINIYGQELKNFNLPTKFYSNRVEINNGKVEYNKALCNISAYYDFSKSDNECGAIISCDKYSLKDYTKDIIRDSVYVKINFLGEKINKNDRKLTFKGIFTDKNNSLFTNGSFDLTIQNDILKFNNIKFKLNSSTNDSVKVCGYFDFKNKHLDLTTNVYNLEVQNVMKKLFNTEMKGVINGEIITKGEIDNINIYNNVNINDFYYSNVYCKNIKGFFNKTEKYEGNFQVNSLIVKDKNLGNYNLEFDKNFNQKINYILTGGLYKKYNINSNGEIIYKNPKDIESRIKNIEISLIDKIDIKLQNEAKVSIINDNIYVDNVNFMHNNANFLLNSKYNIKNNDLYLKGKINNFSIKELKDLAKNLPNIDCIINSSFEGNNILMKPEFSIEINGKNLKLENNKLDSFDIMAKYSNKFIKLNYHSFNGKHSNINVNFPINLELGANDFLKVDYNYLTLNLDINDFNLKLLNYTNDIIKIKKGFLNVKGDFSFNDREKNYIRMAIDSLEYNIVPAGIDMFKGKGEIVLDKSEIKINNFSSDLGDNNIIQCNGIIYLNKNNLKVKNYDISLKANNIKIKTIDYLQGPINKIDLKLSGNYKNPSLDGTIKLGKVSVNYDQNKSKSASSSNSSNNGKNLLKMNIEILSNNYVEFNTKDMKIYFNPNLKVKYSGSSYVFVGNIDIYEGSYYYLNNRFKIISGNINFPNSKLENATLDLLAEKNIEKETDLTIIQLLIKGTIEKPELKLKVIDGKDGKEINLPDKDIIAMLLLNMTFEEFLQFKNINKMATKQIEDLINIYTAKYIEEKTHITTFQIKTGFSDFVDTGKIESIYITAGTYITPELFVKISGDIIKVEPDLWSFIYYLDEKKQKSLSLESDKEGKEAGYNVNWRYKYRY